MRKLLNTLYVLSEDTYLALEGENIVIWRGEQQAGRFPLHTLENIVSFSYKGASPALMGACAARNIELDFFTPRGKFLARIDGMPYGNVLLRREQYRIAADDEKNFSYAKNMIIGKIFNCRWSVERTVRDNGMRVDAERLKEVSNELYAGIFKIKACSDEGTLRGLEGELASRYFSIFDEMIINQKDQFRFTSRNRRPPLDEINALLSFTYTIMGNECAGALEGVGLDPYVGFLHTDRPGRKSLSLDMLEELRGIMCDRFVLTLVNMKTIKSKHFDTQGDGAVMLNEEGRKVFFTAWQQKKNEEIKHPFLDEKIPWGLVPHTQAMLLARTIRGDLNEYPPFLWK